MLAAVVLRSPLCFQICVLFSSIISVAADSSLLPCNTGGVSGRNLGNARGTLARLQAGGACRLNFTPVVLLRHHRTPRSTPFHHAPSITAPPAWPSVLSTSSSPALPPLTTGSGVSILLRDLI